ncbi:MAG: hypothetical protein EOO27_50955, partial [Comamonadaceae bacterium]
MLAKLKAAVTAPGDRVELVVVDNAGSAAEGPLENADFPQGLVIAGDNSNREFTGWDKGVAALRARSGEPDVWLFTNDTLARHHGWSDQRAARFGAEIARLGDYLAPWMLGEINDFPRSMTTPLGPYMECVATYCFAINKLLMQRLGCLSPDNSLLDSLVYDTFEPEHRIFRDQVDPVFVEFISAWMIKDESDPDRQKRHKWAHEWQNVSALNADSFDNLRMKARCYMSEAMLSVRALQLGADIRSPYDAR